MSNRSPHFPNWTSVKISGGLAGNLQIGIELLGAKNYGQCGRLESVCCTKGLSVTKRKLRRCSVTVKKMLKSPGTPELETCGRDDCLQGRRRISVCTGVVLILDCGKSVKHQKRLHQLHCVKQGIRQLGGEDCAAMVLLGYVAAAATLECSNPHKELAHTTLDYKASEDHIFVQQLAFTLGWLTMFF